MRGFARGRVVSHVGKGTPPRDIALALTNGMPPASTFPAETESGFGAILLCSDLDVSPSLRPMLAHRVILRTIRANQAIICGPFTRS